MQVCSIIFSDYQSSSPSSPQLPTLLFFQPVSSSVMVPAAIVIVPVGILFILSGLLVNLIQAIFFVIVRPFSKNAYRKINKVVAELLWFELIWLFDWWAGVKIDLYTDANTFHLMGKERALLMPNHRSDIDWLVGWVLAQRSGCLGCSLAIMKRSAQFLPIIGWSMWFSDYVFLERNWVKDENTLKSGYKTLEDYPRPFWLCLFVEGTRFTEAKLLAAQRYAASSGLPIPRNILIPRTKGFISAVKNMRGFVPAIYDITVAFPKSQPQPTLLRLFKGQSSVVKIHIKRHSMQELPETATGISQWCKDMFIAKDAFLEKYYITGKLNDDEYRDIGRPMKPLIVVIIWFFLLLLLVLGIFQWSSLPTWETVAFVVAFLSLVTIVMQILILFTQSERSNPGRTTMRDPAQQVLLQK